MVMKMREVTFEEYLRFIEKSNIIRIEDQEISLEPIHVERLEPYGEELTDISSTVWSFPKRGSWATHRGDYRGNWAPQIPRALMLMYTRPGEVVLDPMIGSGTTAIEAKLLGRNCIAVDINYQAVMLTLHRLYWLEKALEQLNRGTLEQFMGISRQSIEYDDMKKAWVKVYHGDARNLDEIDDGSVDLIATHPPYFNIIEYSGRKPAEGDLSKARSLEEYLKWMSDIAEELYRVLKPGRYCAILIGDTRIHGHYVPISHHVLDVFLNAGFILKEEVIKIQHKMKTTRELWKKLGRKNFLLIYHEKLFIFRKPKSRVDIAKYRYSMRLDLGKD